MLLETFLFWGFFLRSVSEGGNIWAVYPRASEQPPQSHDLPHRLGLILEQLKAFVLWVGEA